MISFFEDLLTTQFLPLQFKMHINYSSLKHWFEHSQDIYLWSVQCTNYIDAIVHKIYNVTWMKTRQLKIKFDHAERKEISNFHQEYILILHSVIFDAQDSTLIHENFSLYLVEHTHNIISIWFKYSKYILKD